MGLKFLNCLFSSMILATSFLGCANRAVPTSDSEQAASKMPLDESDQGDPNKVAGQIVFSSDRSGSWRIWIMNEDGSAMRQLTECEPSDCDVDPAFSPDGKTILFSSNRGGRIGIWRMPTDRGSKPQRICDGDQAEWSPNGARIVFRRDQQIYTRDLLSGKEKRISPKDWPHCSGPAWSPDGENVAFACRWEAGNAIFISKAEGGKPTKVYDKQGACEPHWSPEGQLLVYETETHICTVRPDGTKNRLITYFGGVQRHPRWSPDAKSIVYCQGVTENGPWEIYTIPSQGGVPVKLTEGGSDMNPDWK